MLATLPVVLISGFVLWYRHYCWKKKEIEEQKYHPCKVLFFPDELTARSLSSASKTSPETNLEEGSLSVLISTLQSARKCIDVCVFTVSCKELGDVLINAHHSNLVVRVITDNEHLTATGSQIERLRKAGIQVRNDNTSYFMHHKFAVIDKDILINGSLNWTLQGICGNQENIVITSSPEMVTPFTSKFERLWEMYNPEKVYQF